MIAERLSPLNTTSIDHFMAAVERKRMLLHRVAVLAGTPHLGLLEGFVDVLWQSTDGGQVEGGVPSATAV